ncbi:hypothetical protein BO86DRAFT_236279 [Aspergillus japonicus CBS 114.51]|uniref:Uncharacterized protein n=1 Tax=Aspergillus japonicus CBS 114.51 TaxID=1448312 RepID=A0A8T8WMC1_ASPJA|nr:hypothetical protein BO86DRAFT_236279 [Aspergillus japonicus CBS 114.51]RAH76968.1 hypothetical protein BO86DRAFT_236279 [Aspergillus japonicus CBS 114.51]
MECSSHETLRTRYSGCTRDKPLPASGEFGGGGGGGGGASLPRELGLGRPDIYYQKPGRTGVDISMERLWSAVQCVVYYDSKVDVTTQSEWGNSGAVVDYHYPFRNRYFISGQLDHVSNPSFQGSGGLPRFIELCLAPDMSVERPSRRDLDLEVQSWTPSHVAWAGIGRTHSLSVQQVAPQPTSPRFQSTVPWSLTLLVLHEHICYVQHSKHTPKAHVTQVAIQLTRRDMRTTN